MYIRASKKRIRNDGQKLFAVEQEHIGKRDFEEGAQKLNQYVVSDGKLWDRTGPGGPLPRTVRRDRVIKGTQKASSRRRVQRSCRREATDL